MVTRSASRLWYASLRNSMLSPSRALDTDWFLQTILFGISKVVCSRLMSSFQNLQKYAAIAGNLTHSGNSRYISGLKNSAN